MKFTATTHYTTTISFLYFQVHCDLKFDIFIFGHSAPGIWSTNN